VEACLIALEATRVNRGFTTPARLLRRSAEQAAEFTHPVLLFPPAERAVVRRLIEIKYGEDTGHLVEVVFSFAEALLQFDAVQN
jgi:hypothetical protein